MVIGGGVDWLTVAPFGGWVVVQGWSPEGTPAGAAVACGGRLRFGEAVAEEVGVCVDEGVDVGVGVAVGAGVVAVAVAAGGVVVLTFLACPVNRVITRIAAISATTAPRKMLRLRFRRRSAAFLAASMRAWRPSFCRARFSFDT